MNFTTAHQTKQARRAKVGSLALLFSVACSGSPTPGEVFPEQRDPQSTIDLFMSAVKSDDLAVMSRLWGTKDGPVALNMDPVVAQQRLRLMQIYLRHDTYVVQAADGAFLFRDTDGARFQVRITRRNCNPVVPFALVQFRGAWLIENVDLAHAGNPARACSTGPELLN